MIAEAVALWLTLSGSASRKSVVGPPGNDGVKSNGDGLVIPGRDVGFWPTRLSPEYYAYRDKLLKETNNQNTGGDL